MDEEEQGFEVVWEEECVSRRFMRADIAVLGLGLLRGIAAAFTETLSGAEALAAAHANFRTDQHVFHEEVVREIETMTSGEDENG